MMLARLWRRIRPERAPEPPPPYVPRHALAEPRPGQLPPRRHEPTRLVRPAPNDDLGDARPPL